MKQPLWDSAWTRLSSHLTVRAVPCPLPRPLGRDYRSPVRQQAAHSRNLVLILARDLASRLATPVFVVDQEGTLIYFNEAAELVVGHSYAQFGESAREEWVGAFKPRDADGNPLALEDLPLGVTLSERKPAPRIITIEAGDGELRHLAVTAFPLFAHADEFVGAVAVFWEHDPDGD